MKLLAVETSSDACSAALLIDSHIEQCFELAPQQHTALILPMVDNLLKQAGLKLGELDALAFGRGPGSFTGVRIAASVVQGLAFGAELPVIPISSLAALAQGMHRVHGVTSVLTAADARMNEVYWAAYCLDQNGFMSLLGDEWVSAPGTVPVPEQGIWFGAGSGWEAYGAVLTARLGARLQDYRAHVYPHAQDIAHLARVACQEDGAVPAEQALPVYLRNEVTWKKQGSQV
ncbi:MAG: tRNA (adenosine(37)-N6)-threonylcarbamoyltransferase complex dimerization subunit type 1 TsaB [Gammaproteobacteria bacterium]|nr:MAG: tRNA (adenosine(37)-N6)-threonylcarbamoyltransferase complex dimerization subunit type 1 TsaB [Gammaproteobacteria bacterium]